MEINEYLQENTEKLFKLLDVVADVKVESKEEGYYSVVVTGEDLGHLIGFKGSVINSIQSFLYFIVRKNYGEGFGVQLNVNNYREKREEALESMVKNAAEKVERTDSAFRFGRLTPYERRFIHTFVSNTFPDLVSYSVGDGPERRLVLSKSEL